MTTINDVLFGGRANARQHLTQRLAPVRELRADLAPAAHACDALTSLFQDGLVNLGSDNALEATFQSDSSHSRTNTRPPLSCQLRDSPNGLHQRNRCARSAIFRSTNQLCHRRNNSTASRTVIRSEH